jgi:GR25 family glycosyltransferase involved in LPS biosynthesis
MSLSEIDDHINNMPIFVINLKHRRDRKERVINELEYHKINGVFVEAINGKNLNIDRVYLSQIYKPNYTYRPLRNGEIGCYLSHVACWNLILKSGKPYGLVLEDDVLFVDNFKYLFNDMFDYIIDQKNNIEWDIIMLGRRCNKKLFYEDCTAGKEIYKSAFYPSFTGYGTYAYIIKADTIKKLLNTIFPIFKPIDVILIDEQQKKNIKVIAFTKNLVEVNSLYDSDTVRIK